MPTAPPQKKLNEWDHTAVQTTFFKSCLTTWTSGLWCALEGCHAPCFQSLHPSGKVPCATSVCTSTIDTAKLWLEMYQFLLSPVTPARLAARFHAWTT